MHIKYLDKFAGEQLLEIKREYQEYFQKWNKLKTELSNNFGDEKERQRKLDLLKYQLNEIESSKLKENEEEELEAQRKIMLNAELITENLNSANYQLSNIAMDAFSVVRKNLEKIENVDEKYSEFLNNINEIYYNVEELARDLNYSQENIEFDEQKRQDIETRLDLIFSLKRKYGNSIEEILNYANTIKEEINRIEI